MAEIKGPEKHDPMELKGGLSPFSFLPTLPQACQSV